jgi:putative ABC transport system permease protein
MFKQLIALTSMGIQTLPQRAGSSSVIVIGIAGVVAVLVSVLAMATGFHHTMADSGRPDRVIVLRGGSDAELNSNLTRSDVDTIANAPGLAKDAGGKAVLSAEIITVVNLPKIDTGSDSNVTLRGVGLQVQNVRPELKIESGRMFRPAVRELIAGAGAAKQFRGLTPGSVLHLRNADWTVTGVFTTNGDVHESELLADVDTVGSAIERPGYSSAVGLLTGTSEFGTFKDALTTDPQLKVDVEREPEYYAAQSKQLTELITVVGNTVAVIMAIGAMFGALNSMYAAALVRNAGGARLIAPRGTARRGARLVVFQRAHRRHPGRRVRPGCFPGHRHHLIDGDGPDLGVRHRRARRPVSSLAVGALARGRGATRDLSCGAKRH